MSRFDRYVAGEFARVLAVCLGGFVTVYLLVDVFDNIDTYIDRRVTLSKVVAYYLFQLPYIVVLVLPPAVLLASMLSVGSLARNNELVAMKVSGVSLSRLLRPLWAWGALLSLCVTVVGGWVLPLTNGQAKRIKRVEIQGRQQVGYEPQHHVVCQQDEVVYHLRVLHPQTAVAEGVAIIHERDATVDWRMDAAHAAYTEGCWTLGPGRLRVLREDAEEVAAFSLARSTLLCHSPETLLRKPGSPDEMGIEDLRQTIRNLRRSGLPTFKHQVELHLRFSFPLACLIMVLLGAPLASSPRRSGLALSFGISIALSFAFFGLVRSMQALGHHGKLPPVLAAWSPDLVFAAVALAILRRVPT